MPNQQSEGFHLGAQSTSKRQINIKHTKHTPQIGSDPLHLLAGKSKVTEYFNTWIVKAIKQWLYA